MLTSERQQAAAALADAAATAEAARRAAGVTTEVGAGNTKPLATMATGDLRKSAPETLVAKLTATTARVNGAAKGSADATVAIEQAGNAVSEAVAFAAVKIALRQPRRAGLAA